MGREVGTFGSFCCVVGCAAMGGEDVTLKSREQQINILIHDIFRLNRVKMPEVTYQSVGHIKPKVQLLVFEHTVLL